MLITREQAVTVLKELECSGVLSETLEEALHEIAMCIEHEDDNLSLWGAEDEVFDLFIARRADLIDEEWKEHLEWLYEKYKIK